jgi:hypothetical protein
MIETNPNPLSSAHLNEEAHEAMQHLQFQMSLLRLTALPNKLRGAEALALRQEASSADLMLEELSVVASSLQKAN